MITYEPPLATKHELSTIYSLKDFYDFLEIIEVNEALKEISFKEEQKRLEKKMGNKNR